jgi:hypothetical protein
MLADSEMEVYVFKQFLVNRCGWYGAKTAVFRAEKG